MMEVISDMKCKTHKEFQDQETGEVVCVNCGKVLQESTEVQYGDGLYHESTESRHNGPGMSLSRHDKGLHTVIGRGDTDHSGKPIPKNNKDTLYRLRMWDGRTQQRVGGGLDGYKLIDLYKQKFNLSDSEVEEISRIFIKTKVMQLTRGRALRDLIAGIMYLVLKQNGKMRQLSDICKVAQVERKRLFKCLIVLQERFEFKDNTTGSAAISLVCSELELSEKVKREAYQIYDIPKVKMSFAGKRSGVIAGTIVYFLTRKYKTYISQKRIAQAAKCTEVSLRNTYKSKVDLLKRVAG